MRAEPTPAVTRALHTAKEWAYLLDAAEVQPAHLLLGLLQDEETRPSLELREPTQEIDTARILYACANRAREALRVVEDYCRFVLDDRFISGELKRLRHDLAEALGELPAGALLEGRDMLGDVGTTLTTA